MNAAGFTHLLRWWLRMLVNARLRPMFCRWREAERAGHASADRYHRLFLVLLSRTDCFPFCVEADACGLWVLDEPSCLDDPWEDAA